MSYNNFIYEIHENVARITINRPASLNAREDVLLHCHDELIAGASVFTEQESDWVIRRLAELLAWTRLNLGRWIHLFPAKRSEP